MQIHVYTTYTNAPTHIYNNMDIHEQAKTEILIDIITDRYDVNRHKYRYIYKYKYINI